MKWIVLIKDSYLQANIQSFLGPEYLVLVSDKVRSSIEVHGVPLYQVIRDE